MRWLKAGAKYLVERAAATAGLELIRLEAGYGLLPREQRGCDPFRDLKKRLPNAKTIFDVGANRGQTAEKLRSTFPDAVIHCFEPDPATFQQLCAEAVKCGWKVSTHNLGFGLENKTGTLFVMQSSEGNSLLEMSPSSPIYNLGGWTSPKGTAEVSVRRLDDFCKETGVAAIDILKLDVQGYELRILEGAGAFLRPPTIRAILLEVNFVPMYSGQCTFIELYRLLDDCGYHLVDMYNKQRDANDRLTACDALFA
jgi:FkbM family methyltransferase